MLNILLIHPIIDGNNTKNMIYLEFEGLFVYYLGNKSRMTSFLLAFALFIMSEIESMLLRGVIGEVVWYSK